MAAADLRGEAAQASEGNQQARRITSRVQRRRTPIRSLCVAGVVRDTPLNKQAHAAMIMPPEVSRHDMRRFCSVSQAAPLTGPSSRRACRVGEDARQGSAYTDAGGAGCSGRCAAAGRGDGGAAGLLASLPQQQLAAERQAANGAACKKADVDASLAHLTQQADFLRSERVR